MRSFKLFGLSVTLVLMAIAIANIIQVRSAQVRKEEAVRRHVRLSCVAQSLLHQVAAPGSTSEKCEFARGRITLGQRVRAVAREIFACLLQRAKQLFEQGPSCAPVLEALTPT